MSKIVSEVVHSPHAIKFDELGAIDLCINKGYVKHKAFYFGFSCGCHLSLPIFGLFQSGT